MKGRMITLNRHVENLLDDDVDKDSTERGSDVQEKDLVVEGYSRLKEAYKNKDSTIDKMLTELCAHSKDMISESNCGKLSGCINLKLNDRGSCEDKSCTADCNSNY